MSYRGNSPDRRNYRRSPSPNKHKDDDNRRRNRSPEKGRSPDRKRDDRLDRGRDSRRSRSPDRRKRSRSNERRTDVDIRDKSPDKYNDTKRYRRSPPIVDRNDKRRSNSPGNRNYGNINREVPRANGPNDRNSMSINYNNSKYITTLSTSKDVYNNPERIQEAKLQKQERLALVRKLLRGGHESEEEEEGLEVIPGSIQVKSSADAAVDGSGMDGGEDEEDIARLLGFGSFDSTKVSTHFYVNYIHY